ncbi:MAG: 30S ribosomal protein S6 [Spirochaetes bacterium]|nr:30S ribosomal protein S6 [Spirochaetota bacterium]
MNKYELIIILRPSDKLESLKSKVREILKKNQVVIESDEPWGIRGLAYTIDKSNDGYYEYFIAQINPGSVKDIIAEFRLQPDILRYLFVRLPKLSKTA